MNGFDVTSAPSFVTSIMVQCPYGSVGLRWYRQSVDLLGSVKLKQNIRWLVGLTGNTVRTYRIFQQNKLFLYKSRTVTALFNGKVPVI